MMTMEKVAVQQLRRTSSIEAYLALVAKLAEVSVVIYKFVALKGLLRTVFSPLNL